MPALVVRTGPEAGRRVEVDLEVSVGRQDGDLVLEDPEVSRRHAVLRRSGESVVVEDLGSTNGTFVNGERIAGATAVGPGDEVRVGQTTLEIELDRRAEDTMVSIPLPPDQTRPAHAPPSDDPVAEDEDATQPLPSRVQERESRPARSNRRWLAAAAVALVVLFAVIAYLALVDRPAEDDLAALATEACAALQQPDGGVDLSPTPTRGELRRAFNIRLQALGAIRALGRPEGDAIPLDRFLSAFGETNASITGLEGAIGPDNRRVAHALGRLRADVRDERELAAKAGMAACGGLAIR